MEVTITGKSHVLRSQQSPNVTNLTIGLRRSRRKTTCCPAALVADGLAAGKNEIHQIIIHQTIILHGKQEYCTSQNKGILYITEIRNIVHHRKQEYCTSLKSGILYITEKKEFCTTQKTGILYNTEIRNIVHH